MSTEKDIAERLRAAFVQHHGNKVGDPFVSQIAREIAAVASGIEARSGEEHGPALAAAQGLVDRRARILRAIPLLRGKNLACWCAPGAPCHADVLLDLAKRPVCEEVKGQ